MVHLKSFICVLFSLSSLLCLAQNESRIHLKVIDSLQVAVENATVALKLKNDSSLVKVQLTDSEGTVVFTNLAAGDYFLHITHLGFADYSGTHFFIPSGFNGTLPLVLLHALQATLSEVTVTARKPFIEMKNGKTIVNVDATISNAGATAMEALEKMPGITIDKDGAISLKGRSGVQVLINGNPTYLDADQIATLLNGMSASQISTVEIMEQPSSGYDAAGNAGIINIRLKKNIQKGFNGTGSLSFAQGQYPKNYNNLQLNYRNGPFNLFLNYSANFLKNFTRIYALRRYYDDNGNTTSMLEQPSFFKGSGVAHNLRFGLDYSINKNTSAGIIVSGLALHRRGNTNNPAEWLSPNRISDSLIQTFSTNHTNWKNAGINFNIRHAFSNERELSFDADKIGYRIRGDQFFENNGITPVQYTEASKANLPSDINITSAKGDYTTHVRKWKLQTGLKTSHITTDNLAAYQYLDATTWKEDLGRSNHFIYNENIHALYATTETKSGKWNLQGGLRYEFTNYDAKQLGNSVVKDSSFSQSYNSLFPSASFNYELDSSNSFSISAGRRIDRPAFQKLNPFLFIINKYTYQTGNPYFRPQYTWNFELSHSYKNILITGLSYSITHDYFSQVFPASANGIIVYTEGNLDRLQTFGASVALQLSPATWWSVSSQAVLIHKKMEGFIGRAYKESVTQGSFNFNNQLRFQKGWSGEVSGFYTSKSRNDIQEVVAPAGQISLGMAKAVMKNRGSIKLALRDVLYTQWMKGNTQFTGATEYFKLTRDTRTVNLSFSYRFGKTFKTVKRSQGASGEEEERVGNG